LFAVQHNDSKLKDCGLKDLGSFPDKSIGIFFFATSKTFQRPVLNPIQWLLGSFFLEEGMTRA
jgi:hypothetical protein